MKKLITIFTIVLLSLGTLKLNAQGFQRNSVENLENPEGGFIVHGPTHLKVNEVGEYVVKKSDGCFSLYNFPPCESFIVKNNELMVKVNAGATPGVFVVSWASGCTQMIGSITVYVESNIPPIPILGPVHLRINEAAHYTQAGIPSAHWDLVNVSPCDASITGSDSLSADINAGPTPGNFTLKCIGTPLINGSLNVFVHSDFPVTVNGSISQDYPDLTTAFEAINAGTHGSGAIIVLINGSHTLTSPAILNGGVFTSCLIKPTAEVTVSGNFVSTLIVLDGADNVTIDGRIGAVNEIKLTLTCWDDIIIMKNGTSDNVIKFVKCLPGYVYSIIISQSIPGSGGNNNIFIEDCNLDGVLHSGGTAGPSGYTNSGIKILRNTIYQITMSKETKDVEIRNNQVGGIELNSVGIINVTGNKSTGMKLLPTDLTCPGSSNTEININNNFFSQYYYGFLGCIRSCIFETTVFDFSTESVSNVTANICYNTIALNGFIGTSWSWWKYFYAATCDINATTGNIIFKNNMVDCHLISDPPGDTYSSIINSYPAANIDADYNSYNFASWYNVTDNMNDYKKSNLNNYITDSFDIYAYRASAFPNEQHSIFKDVNFIDVNSGDLHLTGSSIGDEDLIGIQIPGITTDIDGNLRSESPYRGADEANVVLPVELSLFTSSVNNNNVTLSWTTSAETNNSGFDIERRDAISETQDVWKKIGNILGNGTTSSPNNYEFTDRGLNSGKYNYRLKQTDYNGNYEYFNLSDDVVIGVPEKFTLSQNYPNPFNPVTNLEFGIPESGFVSLKVFDILGKEIMTLVNEIKPAGMYQVKFDGSNLASGVYFYKIQAGEFSAIKKMSLIK